MEGRLIRQYVLRKQGVRMGIDQSNSRKGQLKSSFENCNKNLTKKMEYLDWVSNSYTLLHNVFDEVGF